MTLTEALEGKIVTKVREVDADGMVYLHIGRDEGVIAIHMDAWGMVEISESTLQ